MRALWLVLIAASLLQAPRLHAQAPTRGPSTTLEALESRLARLEGQLSSRSLFELLERLDALQKELQTLRGELEIQAHDIARIKDRQRELFVDLDRMRQSESTSAGAPPAAAGVPPAASAAPPAAGPGVAAVAPPGGPAPTPAPSSLPGAAEPAARDAEESAPPGAGSLEEQTAYQEAFTLLKEGRYEKAADSFQTFLTAYPASRYADNAQYWLGEAYYVTRDFPRSMQEFQKLVQSYPESPKLPGAQLKIGFIHHELGQLPEARKVLGEVIERYPSSTAARLARDRLKRLPG